MQDRTDFLKLTVEIVSSHLSNNRIDSSEIPGLIRQVHATLRSVGDNAVQPDRPQPAVPIKRSVTADHIVCLEDGKKLKMLKRHLMTAYSMTPEQYRERWGLPPDYPMVAPNYANQRRDLAKKIGLGTAKTKRAGR